MKQEDLIYDFYENHDVSDISKKLYRSRLKQFIFWVEKNRLSIDRLTTGDMIQYKKYMQEKYTSELSVASHIAVLKKFYNWLKDNGYISVNIMLPIKTGANYTDFRRKSLTREQAVQLLARFQRKTLRQKRDYAIVQLLLTNGLRISELVRVNIDDIIDDYGEHAIRLQRKGKHDKNATLPLSQETLDAIEQYLIARKDNWKETYPLFISVAPGTFGKRISTKYVSVMIRKKLDEIGLTGKYYTAHSLRHTAATMLLASGLSEYDVMTFMGHRNFSTTQIYTRQMKQQLMFKKNPSTILAKLYQNGNK